MLVRDQAESGFTLITLVVLITVMNVMLAALIPIWSQRMQRERERELIFRGMQYAEAIRVFHERFGRYPMRLRELLDVKPRSIRRLWKDPMTKNGEWALIYAGTAMPATGKRGARRGGGRAVQAGEPGGQVYPESGAGQGFGGQQGSDSQDQGDGMTAAPRPILGVHSKSTGHSLISFFGKREYNQWLFTVRLAQTPVGVNLGPHKRVLPRLSTGAFWRPFRGQVIPGTTPASRNRSVP